MFCTYLIRVGVVAADFVRACVCLCAWCAPCLGAVQSYVRELCMVYGYMVHVHVCSCSMCTYLPSLQCCTTQTERNAAKSSMHARVWEPSSLRASTQHTHDTHDTDGKIYRALYIVYCVCVVRAFALSAAAAECDPTIDRRCRCAQYIPYLWVGVCVRRSYSHPTLHLRDECVCAFVWSGLRWCVVLSAGDDHRTVRLCVRCVFCICVFRCHRCVVRVRIDHCTQRPYWRAYTLAGSKLLRNQNVRHS